MTDLQPDTTPAVPQRTDRRRFKTVKGHCYVLEELLVVTRNRKMTLDQAFETSRKRYLKIGVFSISALFALTYSLVELHNNEFYLAAAYLSLGIGFGRISKSEISKAIVLVIDKKDIINLQFYSARLGRKYSIFEIVHSKDLRVKYTEIYLPQPKNSGKPNTQRALELMDDLLQ